MLHRDVKRIIVFFTFYTCSLFILKAVRTQEQVKVKKPEEVPDLTVELFDNKWDQIQKGQWLIGFFDKETKESLRLEEDFKVFALKGKERDINVARVFAPKNPGLYVRFLVTVFPKVFYVKNGVAHEVKQPTRENLIGLIKDNRWKELKPVNFLSNPFSVQMSLLSHLFVHAVNLYNYEDGIVQKFVPYSSATDVAFALTFIVVGTFLGLDIKDNRSLKPVQLFLK
ncbi:hypothetical protein JTE90_002113 [Oedothorax gibbosus]|uniref:Uncharacterized protein n=1 Tax=Oedothorax gibbosus TaxID=931172 RepID=A0AAV6V981_9ARAC|nr:hypothetical protein JTE90_002113 [Oedothorax gibbosus]